MRRPAEHASVVGDGAVRGVRAVDAFGLEFKVKTEPVLFALLPALFTEAGGTVLLLANDHTTYGLLVAAATLLTGVGGVLARSRVSPV